jgi:glycosyltransferase involved in cell wall biosynthesis
VNELSQRSLLSQYPITSAWNPILSHPVTAFLASFPPRVCGIATFTADLAEAVDHASPRVPRSQVIAINAGSTHHPYGPRVRWTIERDDLQSYRHAAHQINRSSVQVVSIQHEYGLFGGPVGEYVLSFLEALEKPAVLTLHTVLEHPNTALRHLTEKLATAAAGVVVLAERARRVLADYYPHVDLANVHFIPHGTPSVPYAPTASFKKLLGLEGHTVLSTFGLLGPEKGIEYALAALPEVVRHYPDVLYLVLGETHPELRRQSGETYRTFLQARVVELGMQDHVRFYPQYLQHQEVLQFLQATDIYLLPYLNPLQIASGTLSYAVASGKAVVSTPFLHAQELLNDGRGVLAPFRDSEALSAAINGLLGDPERRAQMEQAAYTYGKRMHWPTVGRAYSRLFQRLAAQSEGRKVFSRVQGFVQPPYQGKFH